MSTDRDLELGAALRALPTPEHSPEFWGGLEEQLDGEPAPSELDRRRSRRFAPRGMWLLSAAAAAALVVAAVTLIDRDEGTRVRVTPATPDEDTWTRLPDGPLSGRSGHVAVWTGERMLVWGGNDANPNGDAVGDGAAFDPVSGRWSPMAASPTGPLRGATAVWTGSRMLVWGSAPTGPGDGPAPTVETGAAYDPAADRWTPISPSPLRTVGGHSAVWTGERMLVWGGSVGESPIADGASYDPATDRWTELPPAPLDPRYDHTAVWTGDRMIVWGGFSGEESPSRTAFADGAAYDPVTDAWSTLPAAPIPGRAMHVAVWTGGSMVIWGGTGATGITADGASYDPSTATWRMLAPSPLSGRLFPSAVAAGGKLLLWGGLSTTDDTSDGASYDPVANAWTISPASPLTPRSRHSAVWTGTRMIVWGGLEGQAPRNDGASLGG